MANDDKETLSQNQLAILMQASGNGSESSFQSDYDNLWKNFPKGYLTEQEFIAKFHEAEMFGKETNFSPAKQLFNLIDQNKSGTVDLFEYLLGFVLVSGQDSNMIMNYLFKIFDSDKNGRLSQAEVVDVLSTFFSLIARKNDDSNQKQLDYSLEDITNDVSNAFGDKNEISKDELLELCEKSPIIQDFGMRLQTVNMISMTVGDCGLQ